MAETIAAGSNQPACSHSQPGTLCLPPCATLIWRDELSSEKSHTAVYGAEEHSAEEQFYNLSALDTDCQRSCAVPETDLVPPLKTRTNVRQKLCMYMCDTYICHLPL